LVLLGIGARPRDTHARAETDAPYRATRSEVREQSLWVNAARVSFGRALERRDGTRVWRFRESARNVRADTRESGVRHRRARDGR